MKNPLNLLLAIILCLFGCDGKTDKKSKIQPENMEVINKDSIVNKSTNSLEKDAESDDLRCVEVDTWMDDFRNFRMAIYNNDVAKLETFFNFPFDDKGNSILSLCNISESDWAERKKQYKNADLFYEADLANYYKKIFDKNFTALILKIKSDKLFSKQHLQTKIIEDNDGAYQLFVDYSEVENTLTLNLAIDNNFKDENGDNVSEGEHNIIYRFKIIDDKKLKLERIDVVG